MQLQMTAPMDIGLEQQDLSLQTGQEDIFNLDSKDKNLGNTLEEGDIGLSSEDEAEEGMEVVPQSGDENEKILAKLEAELDDMYEAYQNRLQERDAKSKVRAARDLERDDWHGIESRGSSFDSDEEETSEGGWEGMQEAKLQDSDSGDSTESDEESNARSRKRSRVERDFPSKQKRRRISPDGSDAKGTTSAAAKLWFSQDVFGNVKGLDELDVSEDEINVSDASDDTTLSDAVSENEV